jgi:hypothetical protein
MLSRTARWLWVIVCIVAPLAVRAEPVLDHLPEDAIGFVAVRDLQAASTKTEKLLKMFEQLAPQPIPEPLVLAKAATGLGAGLNEQGDMLLVALPGQGEGMAMPAPLLIVPVSDYAAFAGSVNGDAGGEICRVTIAGEEVLVAKRGSYAVLMNVENRDRLESLLAKPPKTPAGVEPLKDWLAKTDAAAVLTPSGVDLLTSLGQAGLAGQRAALDAQPVDPQLEKTFRSLKQTFEVYETVLGFLGAELDAAAIGIGIDDEANFKLMTQAVLTKGGKLADVKPIEPLKDSPLAGYADKPFVVAAGGPIPSSYGQVMATFGRKMLEKYPSAYGFEKFTDKEWDEVEAMWTDTVRGLRSASMILLPGEGEEPLISNIYSIVKVDDAMKYLSSYAESMKKWNELLARTSLDIKLKYEVSEVEVSGKKGLLMVSDVLSAAQDENVPDVQTFIKAMVGEDGKTRMYLIAVDDNTVVAAMADEAHATKIMDHAAKRETGLAESSAVQTAGKLLDPQATWMGMISPKGLVAWVGRIYNNMFVSAGGAPPIEFPEFPATPAVAFSVKLADGRLSTELAWPVETTQGLVAFIKKCME